MKRFISVILVSAMLLSAFAACITVGAEDPINIGKVDTGYVAEGTAITDAAGFAAMTADGNYYLANDITIDATWNAGVAVSDTYKNNNPFTGTLDGCGHTITTSAPLFANLQGTVKNLTVDGTLADSELHAANISLWTNGTVTIDNVYTKADIPSGKTCGGMIGYAATGADITITNSQNDANISCSGQVGGIVGYVQDYKLTVKDCINNGDLYTTNYGAGIVGRFGKDTASYPDSVCTITGCVNNGDVISEKSQSAGILAYLSGSAVITDCINNGSINNISGAAGGIFGMHSAKKDVSGLIIKNCVNYGDVIGVTFVAGIAARVGREVSHPELCYRTENCVNYGLVNAAVPSENTNRIYVGGIVAYAYGKKATLSNGVVNCINAGTVAIDSASDQYEHYISGILGYVNALTYEVKNNINVGEIEVTGVTPAVAVLTAYNKNPDATDVYNNYSVACGDIAAGYVGDLESLAVNPLTYAVTEDQIASGEVAYLINKAAGETIFYQAIGMDCIPVLEAAEDGSNTVYKQSDGSFGNTYDPNAFLGDVNGDDEVNIRDAATVLLYLAGKDVRCVNMYMDADGNGIIDANDAAHILKKIADHDVEIHIGDSCEHVLEKIKADPATCTEYGSIEYWECSECGKLFEDKNAEILITIGLTDVAPLGHNETVKEEGYDATVSTTGRTDLIACSRCGEILSEQTVIPAKGSEGLEYTFDAATHSYFVSGIGTCTDTHIVIPAVYGGYPVTAIKEKAFENNTNITALSILNYKSNAIIMPRSGATNAAEGVSVIGDGAFRGCTALEAVDMTSAVKSIGEGAFASCPAMESFIYKGTDEEWTAVEKGTGWNADSAFTDAEVIDYSLGLEYTLVNSADAYAVSGIGTCTDTEIVIPSTYNGLPVTKIYFAFAHNRDITSVIMPDTITSIRNEAFWGCTNLENIVLSENLSEIPGLAFRECTSLKELYIPKNVSFISSGAFMDSAIESIEVDPENEFYVVSGNCLIEKETKTLVLALKDAVIPDDGSVTSIGHGAFSGSDITSITIPDSITHIDYSAFQYCKQLEEVYIGSSVIEIASGAFDGCDNIKTFTISENNEVFLAAKNCLINKQTKTLVSNINATEIPSDGSVTAIANGAFRSSDITSIIIPDSVVTIESGAFANCNSLETVHIGSGVTSIDEGAFNYCRSITSFTVSENNTTYTAANNCLIEKTTKTLIDAFCGSTIPSDGSVTVIGRNAFLNSDAVTVTVPDSVTTIGYSAFGHCKNLETVNLGSGVNSISQYAFSESYKLKTVTVSENNAKYSAVDNCIIEKETKTAVLLFDGFKIPSDGSVTAIGKSAYQGYALTELVIPDAIVSIGEYAFAENGNLKSVYIGSGVTHIGENAFSYCYSLQSLTFSENNEKFTAVNKCIIDKPTKTLLFVLEGFELPTDGSIIAIGDHAFAFNEMMHIVIPDGVTTIGDYAFDLCYALQSVSLPASITSIGMGAFCECYSISSFVFRGTEEAWENVTKGNMWDYDIGFIVTFAPESSDPPPAVTG